MSMFDSVLSGLMPSSVIIKLLHHRIEEELGRKIDNFVMHYNALEEEIFFDIVIDGQKRKYPFENGKKYIDIGKKLIASKAGVNDSIDYCMLSYKEKQPTTAKIFFTTEKGEKQQTKITL